VTYNEEEFWKCRLGEFKISDPRGAGRKDRSLMENHEMFAKAAVKLFRVLDEMHGVGKLLDIGIGNGYFIPFMSSLATHYTGIDITDVNFEQLTERYGDGIELLKVDICGQVPTNWNKGKFDTIVMLDVEQHIVERDKWKKMISNVKFLMNPAVQSAFICTTWNAHHMTERTDYEVARPYEDYLMEFPEPDFCVVHLGSYRDKGMFVVERT